MADMIEEESPILHSMDGEQGFFARMSKYAKSQGLKEGGQRPMSRLNVLQDAVAKPTSPTYQLMPLDVQHKCATNNCRSFIIICEQLGEECVCTSDSTFDINTIKDGPKKDYIELTREFSRQNPGASLLLEAWELRKGIKKSQPGPQGIIAHMGVSDVGPALGDEVTDMDELDAWLAKAAIKGGGLLVLGGESASKAITN